MSEQLEKTVIEPREPVAYPKYPTRPPGARRPVYVPVQSAPEESRPEPR